MAEPLTDILQKIGLRRIGLHALDSSYLQRNTHRRSRPTPAAAP
jgi:hypothetical protein